MRLRALLPTCLLLASISIACSLLVSNELEDKGTNTPTQDAGMPDGSEADSSSPNTDAWIDMGTEAETDVDQDADDANGCSACPEACCDDQCKDLENDPDHCGACNHVCPSNRKCIDGKCEGGSRSMSTIGAPEGRLRACAVWTGNEMFVWGGMNGDGDVLDTGAAYDPLKDTWRDISMEDALSPREEPICVAMNGKIFVWSGKDGSLLDDGAIWDSQSDTWSEISGNDEPPPRIRGVALWTGDQVLVWGGEKANEDQERSGALYDPVTHTWASMSTNDAPAHAKQQAWAWSGAHLYVFGGRDNGGGKVLLGLTEYNPSTDTWKPLAFESQPSERSNAFAVWTGTHMLLWGGLAASKSGLSDGFVFHPATSAWTSMSTAGPPSARGKVAFQSGWDAWMGDRMLVVGGMDNATIRKDLATYDPNVGANEAWSTVETWSPPVLHEYGVGVWSGQEFILWGGTDGSTPVDSGTRWMP